MSAHWKKLAALLLLGAAFIGGRLSVPDKPAEVREVEKVVYKDRIVEKVVQEKARTKTVVKDRTVAPDGTVVEHEVSKTDSKATMGAERTEDTVVDLAWERQALPASRWRLGVLTGLKVSSDALKSPLFGASVERRITEGLSVGVWGLGSRGDTASAGVSISYEF